MYNLPKPRSALESGSKAKMEGSSHGPVGGGFQKQERSEHERIVHKESHIEAHGYHVI